MNSESLSTPGLKTVLEASLASFIATSQDTLLQKENNCRQKLSHDLELTFRLSDLSEGDMDYFHTDAEVKLKSIVWTAMNQDYIEKQAMKAAADQKKQV